VSLIFTWGILKSLNKFATWTDVTLEAAPTTPDITFLTWDLLQWKYWVSSILLIEPKNSKSYSKLALKNFKTGY